MVLPTNYGPACGREKRDKRSVSDDSRHRDEAHPTQEVSPER